MGVLTLFSKYRKFALLALKVAVAAVAAGLSMYVAGGGTSGVALATAVLATLRYVEKLLESA